MGCLLGYEDGDVDGYPEGRWVGGIVGKEDGIFEGNIEG